MTFVLVRQASFRVEKMEVFVEWQLLHAVIAQTSHTISNEAILQVSVDCQFLLSAVNYAPVDFAVNIRIDFVGFIAVIFIMERQRGGRRSSQIV